MMFFLFLIPFFSTCIDAMGRPAGIGDQVHLFVPAGTSWCQKLTQEKVKCVLEKHEFAEFAQYLYKENRLENIIQEARTDQDTVDKLKKMFQDYRISLDDGLSRTRRKMADLSRDWHEKLSTILKELGFDENIS